MPPKKDRREDPYGYSRLWSPYRPTVVYVDSVVFGLAIIEMTESVEMRYVNGKYIRESENARVSRGFAHLVASEVRIEYTTNPWHLCRGCTPDTPPPWQVDRRGWWLRGSPRFYTAAMDEAILGLLGVAGCFAFAPRIGGEKVWPQGGFPWVAPGLRVSDWLLAGTVFFMLPLTYFTWNVDLRPFAVMTGAFIAWVLWACLVSVWRRQ